MAVTYRTTSSRQDRERALAVLRANLGGALPFKGRMVQGYSTHETVLMDFVEHQGWLCEQSKDQIDKALEGSEVTLVWEERGRSCPWGTRGTADCATYGPTDCAGVRCGQPKGGG